MTGKKNARLRLEHTAKQKEYLIWKTKMLPQLFQGKPTFLHRVHPISKKIYHYARYQSNSSPILGKLRKIFYPQGRKIIPQNLSKFLNSDIALAIWYLDDGYYYPRDNCAYIYLGRISLNEAEIARESLSAKFGLEAKILDKKKKGFALYIAPKYLPQFSKIISKYPVPGMSYKIPA